jgi:DNA-binding transcriptional ArsR family regulator
VVWRIHFSSSDLTRVRLAPGADPMWEIVHSLHILGDQSGEVIFGPWRRRCRAQARQANHARHAERLRVLRTLAPPQGYFPDFLTPAGGSTDLRTGIEAVLRTPRKVLAGDLSRLAGARRPPTWLSALAAGEPASLRGLGKLMHGYFDAQLARHWGHIRTSVDNELQRLVRLMITGGTERMLREATPLFRWEPPVLLLTNKQKDVDVHLDGRGLVLQPSFFAYDDTTPTNVPGAPFVLAYPVRQEIGWANVRPTPRGRALRSLLGRTRAQTLELLAGKGFSTSELAACLDLSAASASQHAKALREAGLVVSDQRGKTVVHKASALGVELLERTPRF